jgi:DNA polymerase-3 subunit delta
MAAESARVTLVTGPEEFLRDRAVGEVLAAARTREPKPEVYDLRSPEVEPGRLGALASPSLFGEPTVIVLRDLAELPDESATELRALLDDLPDDVTLVLVHHGGQKGKALLDVVRKTGAALVDCQPVKWESDKVAFVRGEFARARRKVTPDGASALVDALGNDLRELAAACSQLAVDTDGDVDRTVVETYHAGRVEVSGFKVADAALDGRMEEALRLLRHALATGVDPVPLNAAFASGLRNIARVAGVPRSSRPEAVARELGMAPFQVKKARAQSPGWPPEGVETAIAAVAAADEQIKGGGTDPVYALERAITEIVAARKG